jgi:hypothetical protein
MADGIKPAAVWKRGLAAILDFFTVFIGGGYLIGRFTGHLTDGGFDLTGWPALALFALVVVYFFVGRRYAGGTVWIASSVSADLSPPPEARWAA